MKIETYDRKAFSVLAVQIDFDNIHEVAKWCKGTIDKQKTRMLGVDTFVPVIKLLGQGDNKGKTYTATLGCYIVELNGSYRIYKPAAFDATFEKSVFVEHLIEDLEVTPETKAEWAEDGDPIADKVSALETSSLGEISVDQNA